MRVGLVVYGGLDETSGGFLYDRKLVEHLRERGDDVEVVALPWRTYPRHLGDNLSAGLRRRFRGDYDVLLADELCHPSLLLANRRLDVPAVALVHSLKTAETRSSRWHRLFRAVERRYLATVDGVVANSRATAEAVGRLVDVPSTVARPGRGHRSPTVSTDEIAARAGEAPLRVLFVGNVVPRKGLHTLVDGLAGLPAGTWRLTAVGSLTADRRYVRGVRRQIDRRDLRDAVTLTGRLPDAELVERLRRHHLLAVPSTYEAFGIVYLEGMGFGLPALATTAGGADEIVADGDNGVLVPPDDPGAITGALGRLLDDRDRLREMGVAARETYEAHHTWTETGNRVRRFLRRLVDGGASVTREPKTRRPDRPRMAPGDVYEVDADGVTDLHYLDVGMYDTAEYGAVYLLDAERPALVDTGVGTHYEWVLDAMDEVGIAREDLAVIAPTHVHLDHAGGAGFLAQACPDAEVVCHEVGAPHLVDPARLWEGTKRAVGEQIRYYTEPEPVAADRIREVEDGDVVDLGDHELHVHHAPGHAPHHCVFEDPANDAVFTADAAGIYVPALDTVEPTTPPPNFDFEQCLADLDLLAELSPSVLLFSHYGPYEGPAPIEEYRDLLTGWVEDIAAARQELGDDEAVVERFVERALDREGLVETWGAGKIRPETRMNVQGVLQYLDTHGE